jgi:hypothetical protein
MDTFIIILLVILVLIYIGKKAFFTEPFANANANTHTNEPIKLFVFVSGHCPHCHTYLNNHHNDVSTACKSRGIEVEKVQSDGSEKSNELFNKYDVQFIPAGILVKGDKVHKKLGSNVTPQSVLEALEK